MIPGLFERRVSLKFPAGDIFRKFVNNSIVETVCELLKFSYNLLIC